MEQIVYARTNAEFLNEAFGTDYKAWMRSRWEYDEDTWVWQNSRGLDQLHHKRERDLGKVCRQ